MGLVPAQFEYINEQALRFQRRRQPVVSVDAKKKELVGDFKNAGREWRRLEVIWADGGYAGQFVDWAIGWYGRAIEIVKRTESHKFVVLPKRWIVERTFAWLGKYRHLSKGYETLTESSEAMINLMVHRLSGG